MPLIKRILKHILQALYVCLPLTIIYVLTFHFLIRINTGDDRTLFGIIFDLPLIILSLPWSFLTALLEPMLIHSYSLETAKKLETIWVFIALFVNAFILLGNVAFKKLFIWASIIPVILLLLFLGAQ
jgi:hypothetical protein